ncbi:hypothetical protein DQ04_01021090 [Trypanosoma grayi]|uniref:hypothetical protein n=1 Tax=Trypanosoma grayi TaxID=71804 RepID=UPI0004F3FCC1|nr:hypothetical protein DQ04_01021090 [Trypanosoma grayi]KEG13408.1 hypothetical protein DQ04_01021090 [Trypanosoma grayi]
MRRFYRLTCDSLLRRVALRGLTNASSKTPPPPGMISATSTQAFPSATLAEAGESGKTVLISDVSADLQFLQKRWEREFRVCIYSGPTAVIEVGTADTQTWTPLVTVDAARLPWDLVRTVENTLAPSPNSATAAAVANDNVGGQGLTVVDLRDRAEDTAVAQQIVAERYPRLRLHVDHSKGTDLQGTVTHTVSVALQHRDADENLSEEERKAKESFFGESIGSSFSCTARRALREAFDATGLPPPPRQLERDRVSSEMETFLDVVRNATSEEVGVIPLLLEDDQVRVAVQSGNGRQISALHGRREDALSILLACVERAAENVNSIATEEARKRIADHPVVLALPLKGLRPKEILRRLLLHKYGLTEKRVRIVTSQLSGGTFTTTVDAELQWSEQLCAGPSVAVTLARSAGMSKKAAEELACITAVQRCFPRIFEEQLSYHTEVREVMNSKRATNRDSICPHVSKGLLVQLRWAAQCQGKQVLLDALQLLPNSENEALGIRTTRALWATQLFLVDEKGAREFICMALDPKKSRSEQKAVAATLWKCYKEQCADGIDYAMDNGLIDKNGDVASCEGISSSEPLPKSTYDLAAEFDPFIPNLQLLPSQPIYVPYRQSLLSLFRRGAQLYVELLNERCVNDGDCISNDINNSTTRQLVENTERITADGSFRTQLVIKTRTGDGGSDEEALLGEAAHSSTAIASIFGALKSLFEEGGVIANASKGDRQVQEIYRDTWERVTALPPFPMELSAPTPLETTAQCVMMKYGLLSELHISGGGKIVNVQLLGRSPASVGTDMLHTRPQFFLGHGRGSSILKAVVSCCRRIFNTHFQPEMDAVGRDVAISSALKSGQVQVLLRGTSILAQRAADVLRELTENKAVSAAASMCVKMDIRLLSSEVVYEGQLHVVDGTKVVELERTPPLPDLMISLRHLTESVAREVGGPPLDVDAMRRQYTGTLQYNSLEQLLRVLYGLPLVEETVLKDQHWHCHLSVHLFDEFYCSIGLSASTKKKDAVETAAARAMEHCFGSITKGVDPRVPQITTGTICTEKYIGFVYRKSNDASTPRQ